MNKTSRGEKNIWLLGSSSFFNDVGSEMISQILPFFITALGGGGVAVGALSGIREGLASLIKLFSGWYSDKIGKRMPFVFLGYLTSVVFRFLLALSNSWELIITFTSLERFGKARDAPRDALIADSTKNRGKGFGIQQMLDTSGAILGSLLALLILWKLNLGFKTIIIIAGIVSAISLIPLFFVREPKTKPEDGTLFAGIHLLDKRLKYFIFVASIFALANFGLYFFLLLRVRELTGSIVTAVGLGVLFNFIWAFFTIPFGNMSDRIGRKKVLLSGYILFVFVALGFALLKDFSSLVILFIAFGFVYAITQANQRALVADLSNSHKGTAQGFYQFLTGIVTIFAGIIAGFIWDVSPEAMFFYLAGVAAISVVLLMFVKEK